MNLSRVPNIFSSHRLRNNWPNPEESVDQECGECGRKRYWTAKGRANDIFQEIKPRILQLLGDKCPPVESSSYIHVDIYMIGTAPNSARPHIMFSCPYVESRKIAIAEMKKSEIYEQLPPGVFLGHWPFPPHLQNFEFLASSSSLKDNPISIDACDEPIISFFNGRPIASADVDLEKLLALRLEISDMTFDSEYCRTATVGAIIELSGRYFGVAPAHIGYRQTGGPLFNAPQLQKMPHDDDVEFEGFSDDDENDVNAEFMSQYSKSDDSSDIAVDSDMEGSDAASKAESDGSPSSPLVDASDGSPFLADEVPDIEDESLIPPPLHLYKEPSFWSLKSNSLDYCLVEIDENDPHLQDIPTLTHDSIAELDRDSVNVIAATGSGDILRGVLSPNSSCIRLPNATRYTDILTVKFDGGIKEGHSGSMVRDLKTGRIYGHIIAGDPKSNLAFVIPALDVLDDAIKRAESRELPMKPHSITTTSASPGTVQEGGQVGAALIMPDCWDRVAHDGISAVSCPIIQSDSALSIPLTNDQYPSSTFFPSQQSTAQAMWAMLRLSSGRLNGPDIGVRFAFAMPSVDFSPLFMMSDHDCDLQYKKKNLYTALDWNNGHDLWAEAWEQSPFEPGGNAGKFLWICGEFCGDKTCVFSAFEGQISTCEDLRDRRVLDNDIFLGHIFPAYCLSSGETKSFLSDCSHAVNCSTYLPIILDQYGDPRPHRQHMDHFNSDSVLTLKVQDVPDECDGVIKILLEQQSPGKYLRQRLKAESMLWMMRLARGAGDPKILATALETIVFGMKAAGPMSDLVHLVTCVFERCLDSSRKIVDPRHAATILAFWRGIVTHNQEHVNSVLISRAATTNTGLLTERVMQDAVHSNATARLHSRPMNPASPTKNAKVKPEKLNVHSPTCAQSEGNSAKVFPTKIAKNGGEQSKTTGFTQNIAIHSNSSAPESDKETEEFKRNETFPSQHMR